MQDLELVAAKDAHTTIVVADQSRCPEEADAQSVRWVDQGRTGVTAAVPRSLLPSQAA
jgi:hypothetical protein